MTYIKIKTGKNGKQKAYYWKQGINRSFPMSLAEAEIMIATESAVQVVKFFWEA